MLIGTPHYMAPEQITTAMDVDARADVWAMGVIIYELLVGETPFEAVDAAAVLKLVRTRQVLPLRRKAPQAPELLEELVTQCLDRDRKKRHASAGVVRDELESIRAVLRGTIGKAIETAPEFQPISVRADDSKVDHSRIREKRQPDADAGASSRVPSLVLKGGRPPTKRRGSALLTLSSPDEVVSWDRELPASTSRPIEAAKPAEPATASAFSLSPPGEVSLVPPPLAPLPGSASSSPPASPRAREQGAPRDLDLDDTGDPALDLDLAMPAPRRGMEPGSSSIPPVLDPRAAGSRMNRSDRPPPPKASSEATSERLRASQNAAREATLTPALTPPLRSPRTPPSPLVAEPEPAWPVNAKLAFGASIVLPALAAFVALRFAPVVMAPLGHAMRGDSPLASGVLAILTLVGAAALATRALGSSRTSGVIVATASAVLLGVTMIIVTFSASETAELGIPPAAGGIVPFIAPLIPLGLGLGAFARARKLWRSRYDRNDAIKLVALTSFMLFALLELGPLGAVRAATAAAITPTSSPSKAPAAARPAL